jgi:hypothetical protein
MPPVIRQQCSPHVAHLREIAASGIKDILALAKELKTETDTLPDELKPISQTLAEITMQELIRSYATCLRLISDLGMQEITQAALAPTHHTEPDSLQRSSSDAI